MPKIARVKSDREIEIEKAIREVYPGTGYLTKAECMRFLGIDQQRNLEELLEGARMVIIGKRKKISVGEFAKQIYLREA